MPDECQAYCQDTCLSACQGCQTTCERSCQNCQGAACQTCQCNIQGCQTCQNVCQKGCLGGQDPCAKSCQDTCQLSCQNCQGVACQTCQNCLGACMSACLLNCQNCQGACMSTCQISCQNCQGVACQACQDACQKGCQDSCQVSCQNCQGVACQSCQSVCEITCQSTCQSYCQTLAQNAPIVIQPEVVHYGSAGINPGTGNYSDTFIDMSIDSPGFKLNISRTYNSKDTRVSRPFGRGWTFGFEGYVQGDSPVSVRLPNGGSYLFNKNSDGTYTAADSRNKLEKAADGTFKLTTKDQYKYIFNASKYLVAMKDRNNNTITIAVDSNGKVTGITDAVQRSYVVAYNADNLIDTITEQATTRRIKYEYTNKLLTKVTDPMDFFTVYSYDSYNFLKDIKDQNGNVLNAMEYDHTNADNLHKLTKITDATSNVKSYVYDTASPKTTITDSNGRVTISWYDNYNYVKQTQDPEIKITTTEYFLEADNITNKYGEEKSFTDRNGNKTDYLRDSVGNVIKITNPDTSYIEYRYDDKNNKTYERDEIGNKTFYIYDAAKINIIKKVQPLNGSDEYSEAADQTLFAITSYEYISDTEAAQLGYRALGLLKSVTTPEGNTTSYTYDVSGNVKTIKDPETLKVKTYEYSSIGLKTAEVTAMGFRTEFEYNKNKQLQKTILKNGKNETAVIVYDNRGRVIKEITPNLYNATEDLGQNNYSGSYGHRYEYFGNGLLSKDTDANNNVTSFVYDLYGNRKSETRPDGGIFDYEYDVLNRLKKISFRDNTSATPILLEEYFYSILPDKRTQKKHRVYLNIIEYADTVEVYDYAGRLALITNPEGNNVITNYNPNSTINNIVDENGKATYFKYDGLRRLIEKWVPLDDISGLTKYSYSKLEYDKDGNKKSEKAGIDKVDLNAVPVKIVTTNYEYYKNNNLKRVTDSAGRIMEYWYDDDGNVSRTEKPFNAGEKQVIVLENNYFKLPNKKKVTVLAGTIYGNDFYNTTPMEQITTFTYDNNGNLATETAPDTVTTTYLYDNLNRRTEIREPGLDETGAAVTIVKKVSYNFEGKIISVTDQNNNITNYTINKRGVIDKVTNPDGGITVYGYDTACRKTEEVMPNSYDAAKTIAQMNRTIYKYDVMGRVVTRSEVFDEKKYNAVAGTWSTNNITKVTKAYRYDKKGNVIKELDGIGYDTATGTTVQDKINNGYGIEYRYNLASKVIEVLDPVSKEKGFSYATKNEYDAILRKVKETDALGRVKTLEYDDAGNIKAIKHQDTSTSPEVILETNTYDFHGNVLTQADANGNIKSFVYNELGKLRMQTQPTDETIAQNVIQYQYEVTGNLKSSVDSMSRQELYTYDNESRILSKKVQKLDGSEAREESVKYDKAGNPRFKTDANGNITELTYDAMNRVKTSTSKVKNVNNIEITHTTTHTYDKNGNKTVETDWRGNSITFVYDGINRVIEKLDQNSKSIEKLEYNKNDAQIKTCDALNNVTSFEYDKNNRLLRTIDAENHGVSQSYDEVGNLKTKTDGNSNVTTFHYDGRNRLLSVVNAKTETTAYTYDNMGNMLTQTDGEGNVQTFEYGVIGQVKKRIDHGGRSGEIGSYSYVSSKVENYTYEPNGKVATITDRNGVVESFTYDIHERLLSNTVAAVAGLAALSVSYTYDNNGNALTMVDATGTTIRKYDELDRVIEKTQPNIGKTVYEYDIITAVESGNTAEKSIDPKGNICITEYDKVGRIRKVTTDNRTTSYEYFDNGTKKSVQYQDNSREEFTYYKDNLLKTLINKRADGSVLESFSYNYDGAHNQTSKIDVKGTTSYAYDNLNRLLSVSEPSGISTSYTFDAAGNRLTETKIANGITTLTSYYYDNQNRLNSSSTSGGSTSSISYTYDSNGNLLTEVEGANTTTYLYDQFNQMIERTAASVTLKAKYNGEGKRVEKQVAGVKTRFLYEGDKIILEVSDVGVQLARNIYGTNLIERKSIGQVLKYFYNGNGDVTALIDDAGIVAATYYYDAFGNILEEIGTSTNPYKYRGYEQDQESGHYYLKARYYNPKTARFITEDTYRGDKGDPLSLNVYTYCHNEPIMYVDPTGNREDISGDGEITYDSRTGNIKNEKSGDILAHTDIATSTNKKGTATASVTTTYKDNPTTGTAGTVTIIGIATPVKGDRILTEVVKTKPTGEVSSTTYTTSKTTGERSQPITTTVDIKKTDEDKLIRIPTNHGYTVTLRESQLDNLGKIMELNPAVQALKNLYDFATGDANQRKEIIKGELVGALINIATDGIVNNANVKLAKKTLGEANNIVDGIIEDIATVFKKGAAQTAKDGATRAAQYSKNWASGSLDDAVEKFAPNATPVTTTTGKTVYKNSETGIQVVYDNKGNYFRIEDTNIAGKRRYLDLNGNNMNNKTVNGKQIGRTKDEYESVTHFNNNRK